MFSHASRQAAIYSTLSRFDSRSGPIRSGLSWQMEESSRKVIYCDTVENPYTPLGFKQMNLQRVTVENIDKQPICERFPIWLAYFSDGLKPPTRISLTLIVVSLRGLRFDVLSNSSQRPLQFLMVSLHARQGWKQNKGNSQELVFSYTPWKKFAKLKRIIIWTTSPWLRGSKNFIFKGGMLWYWSS